jgi:hypothetical protein
MGNTALPRFGDDQTQDLINRLEIAIQALEANPLSGLRVLPPIAFPAFPPTLRVYHGLGRVPQGWLVVKNGVFISFADLTTPTNETDPGNYAVLACNQATTLTLAVF